MDIDNRNFIMNIVVAFCITMLLTLIPVWQLVIIPGIIAGVISRNLKRGILSGLIGVTSAWGIYIIVGLISRNVYITLEQIAAMFLGQGFGWVFIVLILLMGVILGALGGGIGACLNLLLAPYFTATSRSTKSVIKDQEV